MQILSMIMVIMLVFSSTAGAAGPVFVGTLRSSGVVLTNAVHLPDGGTVRSGDTISAKPASLAIITSSYHGRLEIRADSEARLAGHRVRLLHGALASSKVPIEVNQYTIQPQNAGRSWFAVAQRDGRLIVAAHRGNLLIASAGGPPLVVPEGSFAKQENDEKPAQAESRDEQAPQAETKDEEKGKKRRRGAGAAAGAAAGGWTIGGLSHAASVALVVGVGAGVAAASVGAAVALSEDNPSPSQ